MERNIAIDKLKELIGLNLHDLTEKYGVTVLSPNNNVNKGWAGHVIEHFLGLPQNSAQSPNFGSWELKTVSLRIGASGQLLIKETMAITMLDPFHVINTAFEESHLLTKLKKAVIVARVVGKKYFDPTFVHSIVSFDLTDKLYKDVKSDYELMRASLIKSGGDINSLSSKMGIYIQPRTKGSGHGSISRAFYARKIFLKQFLKLD